jgi:hypothetical protein
MKESLLWKEDLVRVNRQWKNPLGKKHDNAHVLDVFSLMLYLSRFDTFRVVNPLLVVS